MRTPSVLLTGLALALLQPILVQAQGEGAPADAQGIQAPAPAPVASPVDVPATPAPSVASVSEPSQAPAPEAAAGADAGIAVTLARVPEDEAAAQAAEPVATADDPMVCRTHVETGTIGRRMKVCMKKSEWAAHTRATRKYLNTMQRSRSTQPGGEALGASSGSPGTGRPGG